MKKAYLRAQIEIIRLDFNDVITTSSGDEPIIPDPTQGNPFDGGYDLDGWT